jgi:hypothetical protein
MEIESISIVELQAVPTAANADKMAKIFSYSKK